MGGHLARRLTILPGPALGAADGAAPGADGAGLGVLARRELVPLVAM